MIDKEGLSKPTNNDENYAVSWCGWGYEFAVTPKQMLDTIPKLKELGIHWATLDDGWFNNYGDWQPRTQAFPGTAIQDMVKSFHDQGLKVQLWWLPLAVEDGHFGYGGRKYVVSDVVKQHPDWLILDQQGKPATDGPQSGHTLPRRARGPGLLQTAHREIYSRLGIRRAASWTIFIPLHSVTTPSITTNPPTTRFTQWERYTKLFSRPLARSNRTASRRAAPAALLQVSLGSAIWIKQ